MVEAAVDDVLEDYVLEPARYDPERGSMVGWLVKSAKNRVLNEVEAQAARRLREATLSDRIVAQTAAEAPDQSVTERAALIDTWRAKLMGATRTQLERAFVQARLDGAPTEAQVAALGKISTTREADRSLVNKVWNRIMHRLRRSDGPATIG